MPLIYEAKCSSCDNSTKHLTEGYIAVIADSPCSREELRHPDEPRLVILAHPGESGILKDLGLSHDSAAFSGRLIRVENIACKCCGTMHQIRRVDSVNAGCLLMLGIMSFIAALSYLCSKSIYISIATIILVICSFDFVTSKIIRLRHRDRAKEFDHGPDCPNCHCKEYVKITLGKDNVICTKCGHQSVTIQAVGIS